MSRGLFVLMLLLGLAFFSGFTTGSVYTLVEVTDVITTIDAAQIKADPQ